MIGPSPGVVAFLGVSAVLVLLVGLWFPSYARARDLRRRLGTLGAVSTGLAVDLGGRRRARSPRRTNVDGRSRVVRALESRLEKAALDLTAGEILAMVAIVGLTVAFATGVLLGPVGALAGAAAGAGVPFLWVSLRQRRRQAMFLRQLPDTVSLLAGAVRAGHSLLQALEQVAREASEPTRSSMEQVVREIGLGASQDEALERWGQRFASQDLDLIITAVRVQQQVGGSLALILDDMADTLRQRDRINRDIAALTAPQMYSAYVLALLPVAVAGFLFLVSRSYLSGLFEGFLRFAAAGAALMVVAGFLIMRRIATIDV